jgi:hypothetical protein
MKPFPARHTVEEPDVPGVGEPRPVKVADAPGH